MRGNWGFLIVAASMTLGIVALALGAHVWRWEEYIWLSVGAVNSFIAWLYSRELGE